MISVLIADDEALVRSGIRMILDADDAIEVLGEVDDGRAAVDRTRELRPDVVLLDLRMPRLDGIEATRAITADPGGPSRVLMLTTFDRDEHLYDAIRAGASGFLLKSSPPEQLIAAVRLVAAGESLLAPALTRRLMDQFAQRPLPGRVDEARLAPLTEREREVLTLIGRALSNAEIAGELFLSEGTVKTHITSIFAKLGLRDRAQAVVLAYESGLVAVGEPRPAGPGGGPASRSR
jgi:DNA-binding NarL/FixJ family response regulator